MPIHIRAEAGDYAEDCLLPGDPLRATYIAEHYLAKARRVNAERALRRVRAGCLHLVSDIVVGGASTRISDEDMRAAVDRMTRVALATVALRPTRRIPPLAVFWRPVLEQSALAQQRP